MNGIGALFALQTRRHWLSLVGLALILALMFSVVLAIVAGALRGGSAWDRFADKGNSAQALINPGGWNIDYDKVRALPFVEGVVEIPPYTNFTLEGAASKSVNWVIRDGSSFETTETPVIVQGRMYDVSAPDEVMVSEAVLEQGGLRIGDELKGDVAGDPIRLRIVGVAHLPVIFVVNAVDEQYVVTTPAFFERHKEAFAPQIVFDGVDTVGGVVRLSGGEADLTRLDAAVQKLSPDRSLAPASVTSLVGETDGLRRSLALERTALLVLALVTGVSFGVVMLLLISKRSRVMSSEIASLTGIGVTRRQATLVAAAAVTVAGVVGMLAGALLAIALSSLFPIGLGGILEPNRGADVDAAVIGAGALLVVSLVLIASLAAAWIASRGEGLRPASRSSSPLAAWWWPLPWVPAQLGRHLVMSRGPGRGAVPAWVTPAIGVFGLVTGLVLAVGLDDGVNNPLRFSPGPSVGVVSVLAGQEQRSEESIRSALASGKAATEDAQVVATYGVRAGEAQVDDTGTALPLNTIGPVGDRPERPVLSGRLPTQSGEIALGPLMADELRVSVGDRVSVASKVPGDRPVELSVVGLTLGDWNGGGNTYDHVGLVLDEDFDAVVPADISDRYELVVLKAGTDPSAWSAAWSEANQLSDAMQIFSIPKAITNARQLAVLPWLLAGLMGALGLIAFLLALMGALRNRRLERAVLRALGLGPGGRWASTWWAGMLVIAFAIVVGSVAGLLVGRLAWRQVASSISVGYQPPGASLLVAGGLALFATCALGLTLLLALGPASGIRENAAARMLGRE